MCPLFLVLKKSGFRAALFLFVFWLCIGHVEAQDSVTVWTRLANEKKLSHSPVWRALLHSDGKTSSITDPYFLLSLDRFSPEQELLETLRYLYAGDPSRVCRFPARYTWLRGQLDLPELSLSACDDLQEFVSKVPSQEISLVFASESIAQPASMMGHAFLKLSGQTSDGRQVSHAITFFTEAEGYNLPKLFFQSVVVGKPGIFALSPFDEELHRYLELEQRKVWFYELRLDGPTRQLIQFHLQELKQTQLVYFFQSYNCATLLRHVLALSGQLPLSRHLWISPKDVVKDVSEAGLVKSVSVESPSGWLVRVISDELTGSENKEIQRHVEAGDVMNLHFDSQSDRDYLRLSLVKAYASYLRSEEPKNSLIDASTKKLSELSLYSDKQLHTSVALNPALSAPDSQFGFSVVGADEKRRYRVSFLPASHGLNDNNSAYTQETELQLLGVAASIDANQRLRLDRLTFYKMQSYSPYHAMVGGVTSKFLVQWGGNPYQVGEASNGWVLSGAVGRTYQIASDIDLFALMGLGYATSKLTNNLPLTAELGAIVREVANMKTVVSYERRVDLWAQPLVKEQLQIDQSKFVNTNTTVFARLRYGLSAPSRFTEFELGLKRLF